MEPLELTPHETAVLDAAIGICGGDTSEVIRIGKLRYESGVELDAFTDGFWGLVRDGLLSFTRSFGGAAFLTPEGLLVGQIVRVMEANRDAPRH